MTIAFRRDFQFVYETPEPAADGVLRIVADNPKDYTFTGTNTYVVGDAKVAIIDPGPVLDGHVAAVAQAVAGRQVEAILVTHSHADHSPAAQALKDLTGAPILGHSTVDPAIAAQSDEDIDLAFAPDALMAHGERITGDGWAIEAVHTPGHFPNHLCFALDGEGLLFSGDHVMGWSTTVISPPLGNLEHYLGSLDALIARGDTLFLPSHGPEIDAPAAFMRGLIAHRRHRERQILECLRAGETTAAAIVERIYDGLSDRLVAAARQSVTAHLDFLEARGLLADGRLLEEPDTDVKSQQAEAS